MELCRPLPWLDDKPQLGDFRRELVGQIKAVVQKKPHQRRRNAHERSKYRQREKDVATCQLLLTGSFIRGMGRGMMPEISIPLEEGSC